MAEATGCCLVAICTPGSTTGHREFIFSSTHLWKEFKFATHQHCRPEGAHLKHRVLGDCNYLKYDDEDGKVKMKRKKYRSPHRDFNGQKGKAAHLSSRKPSSPPHDGIPHPVTALELESRGAQVAAPHPRQHCSQNALEASARRSSRAAAAHTVVAPRQPGGYNWAYYGASYSGGNPQPTCNSVIGSANRINTRRNTKWRKAQQLGCLISLLWRGWEEGS